MFRSRKQMSFAMSDKWCPASTRRLLIKITQHKPAGVSRHFHLMCLVDLLNNIYEDENDIIFEDYLNEEHLNELRNKKCSGNKDEFKVFPPSYKIRPTAAQITEKLNELYGMHIINENEIFPEELSKEEDFELPNYVLNVSTRIESPARVSSCTPRNENTRLETRSSRSRPTRNQRT